MTVDSNGNSDSNDNRGMLAPQKVMVVLELVTAMVEVLS